MKAIILNSGRSTRLYPLTKYTPKALLKVNSKTLLSHQVDKLIECGIETLIMTTGPFETKIKKDMQRNHPSVEVTYVKNQRYRTTNYLYSMWLTKNLIDDAVVLLHGDLFFETNLLKSLLDEKHGNCVLVNRKINPPEKDFKAIIKNGRVVRIGVELTDANAIFLAPLYKFTKLDYLFWLDEIEKAIKRGETKIYAENIFNKLSDRIKLYPVYFNKDICVEIDTKEDLEMVKAHLENNFSFPNRC
jgi:phosphoenolpyruvate phosphomutase